MDSNANAHGPTRQCRHPQGAPLHGELPDQELIRRICFQDADAFEILYVRYQPIVRQHVTRTIRELNASEDITQDVFLRVWTRSDQWNGAGSLRSWLLRIATNLSLNHLRSVRRRRELPLEPLASLDDDNSDSHAPTWLIDKETLRPDQALEQDEWRQRLARLVANLPGGRRAVFRMVYEEEMETRDVAASLGIPEGTVRSRLYYARKQIINDWETSEGN